VKDLTVINNPFGRYMVRIGEEITDRMYGDGYNFNRETFDNMTLELLEDTAQAGYDDIGWILAEKKAQNFVDSPYTMEEVQDLFNAGEISSDEQARLIGDIEHNERILTEIVDAREKALKSTYDIGARLTPYGISAGTQEIILPFLREEKIELLTELTFENTGGKKYTQDYAQRVFNFYEIRTDLLRKQKSERLSPEEDYAIIYLEKFVEGARKVASNLKLLTTVEDQKKALDNFRDEQMTMLDFRLTQLGIDHRHIKKE